MEGILEMFKSCCPPASPAPVLSQCHHKALGRLVTFSDHSHFLPSSRWHHHFSLLVRDRSRPSPFSDLGESLR